ncbi:MAG: hypothetical protein ACI8X5_002478 [Planctomycetota bacterium]
MPVADEVARLQRGEDAESRFFQGFSEEGHYRGRTEPTNTRQGIYAATPGGAFLASVNTRDAKRVAEMLETALAKWDQLEKGERLGAEYKIEASARFERFYPEDGLILRCTSRDMKVQEELRDSDWRRDAWNQDFVWFRKSEVDSMLPEKKVGARKMMPKSLVERLAANHLLDNVRGQTPAYRNSDIKLAELSFVVTEIQDGSLILAIQGKTRAERTKGEGGANWENGLECQILGYARHDGVRFTGFRMIALGRRWGQTQYNAREGQADSKLGIALVLDLDAPRVAPSNYWRYGWL